MERPRSPRTAIAEDRDRADGRGRAGQSDRNATGPGTMEKLEQPVGRLLDAVDGLKAEAAVEWIVGLALFFEDVGERPDRQHVDDAGGLDHRAQEAGSSVGAILSRVGG